MRSLAALFTVCLQLVWADTIQSPLVQETTDAISVHRIAIVGSGPAGSSAAYHLARFHNDSDTNSILEISIFESNHMIGGRTTTINALDDPRYPTEVGASIFVEINEILYNATRDFDLDIKERATWSTGSAYDLGIWDGKDFVLTVANDGDEEGSSPKSRWKGWWDIAKLLWKYGLSPIKTQRLSKNAVGKFRRFYNDFFPFQSLNEAVSQTGLEEFTTVTGRETLHAAGISEQFSRDVIQASTRVNYAQNLDTIHGLETMVCMAIEGAMAVEGGNWQIFDEAVRRSKANVHLNTRVTNIVRSDANTYFLSTNTTNPQEEFDTIILAAPYQFANITFTPALTSPPERIDYVSLHVTLFTSPHRPLPTYFGLETQDQVPDTILTTLPPGFDPDQARGKDAIGSTPFWSFSTLRVLEPAIDEYPSTISDEDLVSASKSKLNRKLGRQYLYKIFSPEPITFTFLAEIFNLSSPSSSSSSPSLIEDLSKEDITWHHTKIWNSYPYLPPRTSFESFHLNHTESEHVSGAGGLWYTSPMEAFISTMETAALSGMNVARLVLDGIERGEIQE